MTVKITVAEEKTNDDQDDVICENCQNMYAFHKDIRDNMCDVCLISIAKKEEISLPFKYQREVCHNKHKTKTQFRQHKHCKFKDNSLTFTCEICNKVWKDEEPFEKHMQQ